MKKLVFALSLLSVVGCSDSKSQQEAPEKEASNVQKVPHKYGGWYCPDNLRGFPPVNLADWSTVPVITDRLPTREETKTEASLMYIDTEKYPNAKAINLGLPRLANFKSNYTNKTEQVIVIQAVDIDGDSVVGFRYLNGGNGSARLHEVSFLSDFEIAALKPGAFVTLNVNIAATQDKIWQVLTQPDYLEQLKTCFKGNTPKSKDWREKVAANYYYAEPSNLTSVYADKLYGCFYVQNDYLLNGNPYVEKFLLVEDADKNTTLFQIAAGPYGDDHAAQQAILQRWADEVKKLSEQ
ncbi:MAG: hypothetical protein KDD41_05645 [Flavobacteriales bacterium]|nr:hypothetical protein [Flavobacteriales bacterium]